MKRAEKNGQGPTLEPDAVCPGVPGAPRSVGAGVGGLPRVLRRAVGPPGEEAPPGGGVGDGWVPYGLPQLPLVVQLALQAARALLRRVRLLLQASDLPPHRLQRAAPRHCAGWRRAGCGGRGRLLRSGCRCRTPERPATPPRPRRQTAAPPAAQDQPGSRGLLGGAGKPQAGARVRGAGGGHNAGAGRAPPTPGICKPREVLRMPSAEGLAGVGGSLRGTWRTEPCREGGHCARDFPSILSAPPGSELSQSNGPGC